MDLSVQKNVIVNRTDTINTYLREIQKYPILTPNEEVELFVKMKEGDKEARNKLILCNLLNEKLGLYEHFLILYYVQSMPLSL